MTCTCDDCARTAPYTPLSCATLGHEWSDAGNHERYCRACGARSFAPSTERDLLTERLERISNLIAVKGGTKARRSERQMLLAQLESTGSNAALALEVRP